MKTDDLIDLLAKDSPPPWRFRSVLTWAVAGGAAVAALLFFAGIGFRPDIADAMKHERFLFKFVVTITLAVTAVWTTISLGHPAGRLAQRGPAMAVAPGLLMVAVLVEMVVLPRDQWAANFVGHNARFCLTLIPLLSIGPLACLLVALRRGAPSHPGLAGAVAGTAASAIAATFYAANCDDDSPLFVLAWYPIAILLVAAAGYLIGRRLLRW